MRTIVNQHGCSLQDRFEAQHMPEPMSGCWLWIGALSKAGYGMIRDRYAQKKAHRVAWELHRGPIPDGLVIDHRCRNKACVNPAHLEPVTQKENRRRGLQGQLREFWTPEKRPGKTHCKRGHEMTEENTYRWRNLRICRTCKSRRWRNSPARKRRMGKAA